MKVAGAAVLLAAIAIGGDSLQLDSGLPAAAVNVLMALILLAVMGRGQLKSRSVEPAPSRRHPARRRPGRASA